MLFTVNVTARTFFVVAIGIPVGIDFIGRMMIGASVMRCRQPIDRDQLSIPHQSGITQLTHLIGESLSKLRYCRNCRHL